MNTADVNASFAAFLPILLISVENYNGGWIKAHTHPETDGQREKHDSEISEEKNSPLIITLPC